MSKNTNLPPVQEDEYKGWDGTVDFPPVENESGETAFELE